MLRKTLITLTAITAIGAAGMSSALAMNGGMGQAPPPGGAGEAH